MTRKDTNKILEEMLLLNKNMDIFYKELRDNSSKVDRIEKNSAKEEKKKKKGIDDDRVNIESKNQKELFREFTDSISKKLDNMDRDTNKKSPLDVPKFFKDSMNEFSKAIDLFENKNSENRTMENLVSESPPKIIKGSKLPIPERETSQKLVQSNLSNVITTNPDLESPIPREEKRTEEILGNIQNSFEQREIEQRKLEEALLGISEKNNSGKIPDLIGNPENSQAIVDGASFDLKNKISPTQEENSKNLNQLLDLNNPLVLSKESPGLVRNRDLSNSVDIGQLAVDQSDPLIKQISESLSNLTEDQNLAGQFMEYVKKLGASEKEGLVEEPSYLKEELDRFRISNSSPNNFSLENLQRLSNPVSKISATGESDVFVEESPDFLDNTSSNKDLKEGDNLSMMEKVVGKISESAPNLRESILKGKEKLEESVSRALDRVEMKKETNFLGSLNPQRREEVNSAETQEKSMPKPPTAEITQSSTTPKSSDSMTGNPGKNKKEIKNQSSEENVVYTDDLKQIKFLLSGIFNVLNGPMSASKEDPYRPYSNQF
jgi:hypothetical protein